MPQVSFISTFELPNVYECLHVTYKAYYTNANIYLKYKYQWNENFYNVKLHLFLFYNTNNKLINFYFIKIKYLENLNYNTIT